MSLLVWLPMTKDLRNNGLSDITVTNTGATLDSNGKLGKCYAFTSNHRLSIPNLITTSTTDFSISFWAYVTEYSNSYACICSNRSATGGKGVAVWITAGYIRFDDGANTQGTYSFQLNTWTHIAITRTASEKCIYVNGQKIKSATSGTLSDIGANMYIGADTVSSTTYSLVGKLNDFRIYDHALSAKEVELLSRGLVAHYPLSNNGCGSLNLLHHTNINKYGLGYMTTYSSGTIAVDTTETFGGVSTICIQPSSSSTSSGGTNAYNGTVNLTANKKYCYSCWIKSTVDDTFTTSSLGHFQTWTSSAAHNRTIIHEGDSIPANKWTKVYITFTPTVDCQFKSFFIYFASTSQKIWISNVKLEEGDHPTSWAPSVSDTEYSSLSFNSTIEYDVSGYQNDMTKTGTITYTNNSAKYSASSHFINGSYLIGNQNVGEILPKDAITVNLWVKPTTWSNPISCTEGGGFNFEGSTIQFPLYVSGVGYKTASSGVTGASLQDGKWHMLTGTFSSIDQQVKIYIDGELKATTATGSSNGIGYASNRLVISGEASGGAAVASSQFVGEESDVRIYATTLTADQIKELYNSSANIAKNGTMIAYEFIEN